MDLIYANKNMEDLGVLLDYEFDLAFGSDENDFELKISAAAHCCQPGFFVYIEGTEYGGIIDSIESQTATNEVIYRGRTWHGILNSHIITPPAGADYQQITLASFAADVTRILTGLKIAANSYSGSGYPRFRVVMQGNDYNYKGQTYNRYIGAYDGISKVLRQNGGALTLKFRYSGKTPGVVDLQLVSTVDYSEAEELDADLSSMTIKKTHNAVNHLICLGSGELKERMVVHLVVNANGGITKGLSNMTFVGVDEYAAVLDYPNAESEDELVKSGMERLKELLGADELSVDFDAETDTYNIGDTIGAYDDVMGVSAAARITKKIVTIKNGVTTVSYEVGE